MPNWTKDELSFQCAVAEGALDNITKNIKNVDIGDLMNVTEAFHRLTEEVAKYGRTS